MRSRPRTGGVDALSARLGRRENGQPLVDVRSITLAAMSRDASHYALTPQAVVRPVNEDEVSRTLAACSEGGVSVTFRAGGTSLSGQAVSDGVILDTQRGFRSCTVEADGRVVRVQPGVTLRAVNARLRRFGRVLGPDPASEIACTVGGVVANNSSGMTCGTHANAYRTVRGMRVVLADGRVVDTETDRGRARFACDFPELHDGLLSIHAAVAADAPATAEIRRQFAIKNTMGYSLNAFVDFDDPVDVFNHVMVGSEGTLGFISSVTFDSVVLHDHRATALLIFDSAIDAVHAIPLLTDSGARAVELMNHASLASTRSMENALSIADGGAGLLVEYQESAAGALDDRHDQFEAMRLTWSCTTSGLSQDPGLRQQMWTARKGLLTTAASTRPSGTISLLEDISFPAAVFPSALTDLEALLQEHGYRDTPIFGHAKDANLHFLIAEDFASAGAIDRYDRFTLGLVDLVLGGGGSLKAEHGTGRVMAPFLARQYGPALYETMRQVKSLFDPAGVLNPNVLLSDDRELHLRHLKTAPPVHPTVDSCIECGFCEPTCPSASLTTTPRQRIVIERRLAELPDDSPERRAMAKDVGYEVVDTCATDGTCALACPVGINTGELVKLRRQPSGRATDRLAALAARHWRACLSLVRVGLWIANTFPALAQLTMALATRLGSRPTRPALTTDLPQPGRARPSRRPSVDDSAVYFPSCLADVFAAPPGRAVGEAFLSLCDKSGVTVRTATGRSALCCAVPWTSKGLQRGAVEMAGKTFAALWEASEQGRLPVVCDAASCTQGLQSLRPLLGPIDRGLFDQLTIIDSIAFAETELVPRLATSHVVDATTVHPTCATDKLGLTGTIERLAHLVSERVVTPDSAACCGFAGDRGFSFPELTAAATRAEADEVGAQATDVYVSANAMCEFGMTRATGHQYHHVVVLLDRGTQPQ